MGTQKKPARKKRAGAARKKVQVKTNPDQEAPAASGEAGSNTAPKRPRKQQPRELAIIEQVMKRYKKQAKAEDFTVTTAEVTKLIQLKQELRQELKEELDGEPGRIGLRFGEVSCMNSDSAK